MVASSPTARHVPQPAVLIACFAQKLPDGSCVRPNGTHSSVNALMDQLNKAIQGDEFVHEVACVVEPGTSSVRGMSVQVCVMCPGCLSELVCVC